MEIRTNMHTIFMLIGPTESGKSTFAKQVLIPQLHREDEETGFKTNVQYISSDQIRQEILGVEYHKHDQIMLESSEQAFHLLFQKLRAVTSFPINAEFVIIDTTGLAEEFRTQIADIAKQNNYNLEAIVFDYKNREDFYLVGGSKRLITNHVTRLKREVLKQLTKLNMKRIHRIRDKKFYDPMTQQQHPDYRVVIEDDEEYLSYLLPQKYKYIVIGDIHERVEEVKHLLQGYGFKIENNSLIDNEKLKEYRIVLVGDWIDKGKATRDIIDFIDQNKEYFYLVKGNHENFVQKYLTGYIDEVTMDQEIVENYFDSIPTLKEDEELQKRFLHLVQASKEFYRFIGLRSSSFYVTHAPCENRYIGKINKSSLKKQRRFSLDRTIPYEEQLSFIEKEAVSNHPYHLFGHVATKEIVRLKNKINLDTGCVHGNFLTSVALDSWKPFFKQQKAVKGTLSSEELPIIFKKKKVNVSIAELDDSDKRRLDYVMKNKINFISGTMSPADKDVESNDLESLKQGLAYYKKHGAEQVVLQPKYMGSRCNIYLDRDMDKCYAVSRNGYKVNQVDLTEVYEQQLSKHKDFMESNDIQTLVLDGELLPWKALGEGLINRQFKTIEKALETELLFLQQHQFDTHLAKVMESYKESGYEQDENKLSKKELNSKYGDASYQTYKSMSTIKNSIIPLDDHLKAFQSYKEQIKLYGQEAELQFKPFSILKMIKLDHTEELPSQTASEIFSIISEDEHRIIDFNDEYYLEKAIEFFLTLTTVQKMEGVVIIPERVVENTAPNIKVRNPEYLTIVYGYDYRFPHKYSKLLKQKNIKQKIRTSINEYQLGQHMLSFNLDEIDRENKKYKQVVANMLFEVSREKEIDPRL